MINTLSVEYIYRAPTGMSPDRNNPVFSATQDEPKFRMTMTAKLTTKELWSSDKRERLSFLLKIRRPRQMALKLGLAPDNVPAEIDAVMARWENGTPPSANERAALAAYIQLLNVPLQGHRARRKAERTEIQVERMRIRYHERMWGKSRKSLVSAEEDARGRSWDADRRERSSYFLRISNHRMRLLQSGDSKFKILPPIIEEVLERWRNGSRPTRVEIVELDAYIEDLANRIKQLDASSKDPT